MQVLITGALGHVGWYCLQELLGRGHTVRALDLPTPANQKRARSLPGRVEVAWGDLRDGSTVAHAAAGQEAAVHVAFILPPRSEQDPELAQAVNVEGSRRLIEALQVVRPLPRILFTSSFTVHSDTRRAQDLLTPDSPLQPLNEYTRNKVAVEKMVRQSGLPWCILRLGDVISPRTAGGGFKSAILAQPFDARKEFVDPRDVAVAIANCLECPPAWGRVWMIGGGKASQVTYGQLINGSLQAIGVGPLPKSAFGQVLHLGGGWMDTAESEVLLHYQHYTFSDYLQGMRRSAGPLRPVLRLLGPVIRWYLMRSGKPGKEGKVVE